ncbi:MAG TPA: hypothetical protein VGS17_02440 [Candidatus Limnocylindria bacterium]|nr:hypothetical protein [Candidatus Limnocylindria bacterium]
MRLAALAIVLAVAGACGGAGLPAPTSPTPIPPIAGAVLVTTANDRGTVHARVGDTIQIALGSNYDWRLDPPDGVVLVRSAQNYLLVRGTQAVWTAVLPGTSTLTATGTVICPSGQACIMIALLFKATVVVAP